MRQAINNLQSTHAGFKLVNEVTNAFLRIRIQWLVMLYQENVFKVCDQPHPKRMHGLIDDCLRGNADKALDVLREVWMMGYSVMVNSIEIFSLRYFMEVSRI